MERVGASEALHTSGGLVCLVGMEKAGFVLSASMELRVTRAMGLRPGAMQLAASGSHLGAGVQTGLWRSRAQREEVWRQLGCLY